MGRGECWGTLDSRGRNMEKAAIPSANSQAFQRGNMEPRSPDTGETILVTGLMPRPQCLWRQAAWSVRGPSICLFQDLPQGHQGDAGAGRKRKPICMKHLFLLMSL